MNYRKASTNDISAILDLHRIYHVDTVSDSDRADGFVTTQFTIELLSDLILIEEGLFIAVEGERVIAYVMSASWQFCSRWPMFQYMIERLHEITFLNQRLSTENSYQYGPICVAGEFRGKGVMEKIFDFARTEMNKRYPILVTFVNKANPRSVAAHIDKLGLDVVMEFDYNNNNYIELVCDASKPIAK